MYQDYSLLYYYDQEQGDALEEAANTAGMSDAKDVYAYRLWTNWWSQGENLIGQNIQSASAKGNSISAEDYNRKSLLNYRAEELASFESLCTYGLLNTKALNGATEDSSVTNFNTFSPEQMTVQQQMLLNFMANTFMIANTGIITDNYEYYTTQLEELDNSSNLSQMLANYTVEEIEEALPYYNKVKNVDIGLCERPKAQVKLYKEVSNVELKLADGQTLFNSNVQAKDLMYDDHNITQNEQLQTQSKGHMITYSDIVTNRFVKLKEVTVSPNTKNMPEIIQLTIDDELMEGSVLNISYRIVAENVGEVDYNDAKFYYAGQLSNPGELEKLMSKTNVVKVIDYVANDTNYDVAMQNADANWVTYAPNQLINSSIVGTNNGLTTAYQVNDNSSVGGALSEDYIAALNKDYINREYAKKLITYNTLIVTEDLYDKDGLVPTLYKHNNKGSSRISSKGTSLILTTSLSQSGNSADMTYNNLAEVIETMNTVGRRMRWSRAGNQEMADQSIDTSGIDTTSTAIHQKPEKSGYDSTELVTPTEIDADSSQKVQVIATNR